MSGELPAALEIESPLDSDSSAVTFRSLSALRRENSNDSSPLIPNSEVDSSNSGPNVLKYAYLFDGQGSFRAREWSFSRKNESGNSFSWYHVEIPRTCASLSAGAISLIRSLYPALTLAEVTSLVTNGPFCGTVQGSLVFRINCTGPLDSPYTLRMSAHVTEYSMVTVSLGRIPRLEFVRSSHQNAGDSNLRKINESEEEALIGGETNNNGEFVINEELLEELLRKNHSHDADNPIPSTVAKLLIHFVDTFVDHLQDMVVDVEVELEVLERKMDQGDGSKQSLLEKRTFPQMNLRLQKLVQAISHSEVVFPKVKQRMSSRNWAVPEDLLAIDSFMSRLRRNKENVGFLASRITALQASLDQWQSEQINHKLYFLSFLSMVFLPLSIITGLFGMNVGGVPWTPQVASAPETHQGFNNVLLICVVIIVLMLIAFGVIPVLSWVERFKSFCAGSGKLVRIRKFVDGIIKGTHRPDEKVQATIG